MLEANFISGYETVTVQGLTQWDKGQKLQITGLATLPATFQVHFANIATVEAIVMLGSTVAGVGTVDIPNSILEAGLDVKAWIYVIDAEGSETIKTILFPLTKRTKPADFISEPNPTEQSLLEQTMSGVNAATANMQTQINSTNSQVALKANQSDLDATNANVADLSTNKADKSEVTNIMTPKGNLSYASLPATGNTVGWYYYCPDGDGTHGAGNYVWDGTAWYFGGTGDGGYNILKNDLVNLSPLNINYQRINVIALANYLGGTVQYNKNIGGYNTSTYLPNIGDGDDIVVTLSTSEMTAKGITGIKWIKGTSDNAYVGYTQGVTAFNSVISPSTYLKPSQINSNVCLAISKNSPYILIKANLENITLSRDIQKWIEESDIKDSAKNSIISSAINNTNLNYISDIIQNRTYNPAADGSVLVDFTKMTEDTECYILLTGNYTFATVQCWSDTSTWTLYKTYYYNDNKNENGLKIVLPSGCGLLQIRATKLITSENPITVKLEKLLIDKRVEIVEQIANANNILATVNMFNSIGAIGDSYTAGSAKHSDDTWTDVINQSWVGVMAKRSGIDFSNYGKGGATTQSYITDKLPSVLSANANDLYFFALGQNDANQSITLGTVDDIHEDYTQNPNTFYGYYGRIIQQIKNHAPKAKLVMIKIHVQGASYDTYSNAIQNIANHYDIPCINPFDDEYFASKIYRDYKLDGHPTALGYSMMGIAMERLFSKCVIENMNYFLYATIG